MNAEELAANKYDANNAHYSLEQIKWMRLGYAAAIREHSQPLADERDELISCIPEGYMVHSGGNAIEALRFLVASYRVTIDEHNQWRDAANELQKERDELREALENCLWVLDGTVAAGRNTIADDEVLRNGRAVLAKYPKP